MSEWIDWSGGNCPVAANVPIEFRLRSGKVVETKRPQDWLWGRASGSPNTNYGEIVAYRQLAEAA